MAELEKDIEKRLAKRVREELGGRAYKFVSPGNDGVPDRIVFLPNGETWFVELKAERGKLTKLQLVQLQRLAALRQRVVVLNGRQEVDRFVNGLKLRLRFYLRRKA